MAVNKAVELIGNPPRIRKSNPARGQSSGYELGASAGILKLLTTEPSQAFLSFVHKDKTMFPLNLLMYPQHDNCFNFSFDYEDEGYRETNIVRVQ